MNYKQLLDVIVQAYENKVVDGYVTVTLPDTGKSLTLPKPWADNITGVLYVVESVGEVFDIEHVCIPIRRAVARVPAGVSVVGHIKQVASGLFLTEEQARNLRAAQDRAAKAFTQYPAAAWQFGFQAAWLVAQGLPQLVQDVNGLWWGDGLWWGEGPM